jgi:hypothetical protein
MSKHESPPFRMRVESGRLVPAAAWEQERLATYRNGSFLTVQITQQKNRKLERKYWAILHEVVEHCPVKQRTAEDLHRAIRLKLGVVDAFFTVDGKLRVDVKSTTGMEDPEYQRFFDDAMALLHEVTGVDPLTLNAESADVGEDETEPSAGAHTVDEGSGGVTSHSPGPAAADSSPQGTSIEVPADEAVADLGAGEAQADPAVPAPAGRTKAECLKAFMRTATDAETTVTERRETLAQMKEWWKSELPDDLDFVKQCLQTTDKVAKGELLADAARKYLGAML